MPTLLTSGLVIDHLAHRVRNYRHLRKGLRNMALQLKGLRANVNGLRSDIDEMSRLAAGGREKAAVLKSHLGDIQTEIGQHVDDIEFTANILGNSGGAGEAQDSPKPPPATQQAQSPEIAPAEAAADPAGEFRG